MKLAVISIWTKRIINIILAIIFLYLLFLVLRPVGQRIIATLIPPRNPPNVLFGQLEPIRFVSKEILGDPEYELNTTNGRLPTDIPDRMFVFEYQDTSFSYQAGRKAQSDAEKLGFTEEELTTDLRGDVYIWRDFNTNSVLTIDTATEALTQITPLEDKRSFFTPGSISEQTAENYARDIFRALGRSYSVSEAVVTLGRYAGSTITVTDRPTQAGLARVDFFREVGPYKVLGPDAKKGLLHAILRRPQGTQPINHPIIEAYNWEINREAEATYPIIPVSVAWEQVRNGNGIISNVSPGILYGFQPYRPVSVREILINDVYLAYYEDTEPQTHMQPIYVFEGNFISPISVNNGDITIYYPAIDPQYVKQATQDSQE